MLRAILQRRLTTRDPCCDNSALLCGRLCPPSHLGAKVTLSDFRGKKNVVLAFYPAAFTPV
ncbi:MAG: alkyl hydroperoxide reductase [Acidobacteria bacterium]|nr:MAG: alkyl hydroperoxide reductase [Acidobacteriota bacterium]